MNESYQSFTSKKGKPVNIPVLCINDSHRPAEIPISKWVKKHEEYTVIEIVILHAQNGLIGFRLKEIDLTDCMPYQYFSSTRFDIIIQDLAKEAEEAINKLLEESLKEQEVLYNQD